MPLVQIAIRKSADSTRASRIGAIIYEALRYAIDIPDKDNFQILTEHEADHFIYDPSYMDIDRSDGLVFVQITLSEGRTREQKQRLYRTIVDRLHEDLGVRTQDVFINLIEVKKENWSFGNGIAQYVN